MYIYIYAETGSLAICWLQFSFYLQSRRRLGRFFLNPLPTGAALDANKRRTGGRLSGRERAECISISFPRFLSSQFK